MKIAPAQSTPVNLHHVPLWFRKRLKPYHVTREMAYQTVQRACGDWLDHWGSATICGVPCFVAEPYDFSERTIGELCKLCKTTGLQWWVSAESEWYPGSTYRVVLHEPVPDETWGSIARHTFGTRPGKYDDDLSEVRPLTNSERLLMLDIAELMTV